MIFSHGPIFSQDPVFPKQKKNKWALVQGKKNVTEYKYDTIQYHYNHYYIAKLDGKWGVLDKKGVELIPFEYDGMSDFAQGRLKVNLKDKYGLMDTMGKLLCEIKFEEIDNFGKDSSILVRDKGIWMYIKGGIPMAKDTMLFKNPDRIAVYGDCSTKQDVKDLKKCSQDKIIEIVHSNLELPKDALDGISGNVIVSFWVSPSGNIEHKEIIRDIGKGLGTAALNVLKHLNDWTPAIKDGIPVWSEVILPIRFSID